MRKKQTRTRRKKNPLLLLAPLLIFMAGAGIFLYPAVSNLLAEKNQHNVIRTYRKAVEQMDEETLRREWDAAVEYNENLAGDPVHDPFVMGSGYVLPDNYEQVLNLNGDGVMGYVEIPDIDVCLPIYHGTSEESLRKGAGHLDVTALPIGGDGNHAVISAHRGLPSAELFTRLNEMEIGDVFYISVLDKKLAYEVDRIDIILPEELSLLEPEKGEDLVTLLTCTPYSVNTHRLLVRGRRIPYEEPDEDSITVQEVETDWFDMYILGVFAGAGIIAVAVALNVAGRSVQTGKRSVKNK